MTTPAMAYSMTPPLEFFRSPREAPEQNKEGDGDRDVKQIQHGYLTEYSVVCD